MQYLKRFFEEKCLPFVQWELLDSSERLHIIDNEQIIKLVLGAPREEQEKIADTIRRIDFANGDVNHFLRHLAQGYIHQHF